MHLMLMTKRGGLFCLMDRGISSVRNFAEFVTCASRVQPLWFIESVRRSFLNQLPQIYEESVRAHNLASETFIN